ncbi:MAG: sodium:solute symporter family protein [Candidatus Doudnabacteria bacterium]|jgi:SSS family solute:Na+ symporter
MQLTIIFFVLYILIVIAIGLISSRKQTEEGFMIGDRQIKGFQLAATMSAGWFDGSTLAIFFAYLYQYGFSAIWMFFGILIGFLFFRQFAHKIKQKADELKVYTMPEYYYKLFGKKNGLMFSLFLITQFFLLLIVNLIVSGKVLSTIFSIPYFISVTIGGVIILSYLLLAGFKAVVRTDFFQLIIMLVMAITTGAFLFHKTTITLSTLNFTNLGFGNIVGFIILAGLGVMIAPDLWQRLIASKDVKQLKNGLALSGFILVILGLAVSILGLATKQYFPNIKPEDALVIGFSNLLPGFLASFGMVLLYAVSLSSSDTITFVISSILTRDIKNYTKKFNERSMKNITRYIMVLLTILACIVGVFYQKITNIGLSLASLNLALFPVVFGSLFWNLKEKAVFWSLILAYLSVVVLFINQKLTPENAIISLPVALISLLIFSFTFKHNSQTL